MKTKNSRTKELLKFLATCSGIFILSVLDPRLPTKLLRAYVRERRFQRGRFLRDLRRLQERDLMDYRENPDGSIKIVLKRRGESVALAYKLEELSLKRPARWDRKWRLVMFDIPHSKKQARDTLRKKLVELGFYPLQKSVFVYPHHCENEIDFICSIFDVRRYVLLISTPDFEGSEKLRHHFNLA